MSWFSGKRERGRDDDRIEAMYGEMGDGELLGLSAAAGDLTEAAQAALAAEMKRRGLVAAAVEEEVIEDVRGGGDGGWKTLHVFSQTFEAQAAFKLLEREEIEFAVEDRTIDERGEIRAGAAVQLALLVRGADWDRTVTLLRRRAGLFPEAVVDPRGDDAGGDDAADAEGVTVTVGEFEEAEEVEEAGRALDEAGVWFRVVTHAGEMWERSSIEVREEDGERGLAVLERLLEADAGA